MVTHSPFGKSFPHSRSWGQAWATGGFPRGLGADEYREAAKEMAEAFLNCWEPLHWDEQPVNYPEGFGYSVAHYA